MHVADSLNKPHLFIVNIRVMMVVTIICKIVNYMQWKSTPHIQVPLIQFGGHCENIILQIVNFHLSNTQGHCQLVSVDKDLQVKTFCYSSTVACVLFIKGNFCYHAVQHNYEPLQRHNSGL